MLREGSFALASFGRVRKVHETAFTAAFGRKSVAMKRILDAAFESPSSPGEAILADLIDVLLGTAFTPIDRLAFWLDHFESRARITNQVFRAMNSAT